MEIDKYKNTFLNIAVLILAVVIASNIHKSQARELQALNSKKEMETKKNSVLENISQFEKKINSYKKILTRRDSVVVINTITSIAKNSGVKVVTIRPLPEALNPEYTKIPFELSLNADSYHSLGKFISKLESHTDVYIIDYLAIASDLETDNVTASLRVSYIIIGGKKTKKRSD